MNVIEWLFSVKRHRPVRRRRSLETLESRRVFCLSATMPGDANRDSAFDSSDLVQVFQAGEFEDEIAANSTWETGDWNQDREFTTEDLTLAFQVNKYQVTAGQAPACDSDHGDNFSAQRAWPSHHLTYAFRNYTSDLPAADIRLAIQAAFAVWSDVARLSFEEVTIDENPNLEIGFYQGDHGDVSPFDGPGSVLAHAYFPPPDGGALAGDVHFDDAELWSVNGQASSVDLETVAIHEIGHSLGLQHSHVVTSVMYPYYRGPQRTLDADDIAGMQSLYGARPHNVMYEGASSVTAMSSFNGGVLVAFTNVENNPTKNRVHWSPDGHDLGSGPIVYEGVSPITAMISYKGGVLTAFSNVNGDAALFRVHWSPDGTHLGDGPIVYEGASPVTAMTMFRDGVLTAFSMVEGQPNLHRVHWSPNGQHLGEGPVVYEGISPITSMIAYRDGVLTAFSNVAGQPNLFRVHWSPDGRGLGSGPVVYEGVSNVASMTPYQDGVLTAFGNVEGRPELNRIHWSSDGQMLGSGPIVYEGISPIKSIATFGDGVLTAFDQCEGDSSLHRIHWSDDGQRLGG